MNVDTATIIGSTHAICQDYAVARSLDMIAREKADIGVSAYAIISDGCSSSEDTDFGARLLVRALAGILESEDEQFRVAEIAHRRAAWVALRQGTVIGLQPQALDATLLSIVVADEDVSVACSGDGVAIIEATSGECDIYSITSPEGFPLYPAYIHQPARLNSLSVAQQERRIEHLRRDTLTGEIRSVGVRSVSSVTEIFQRPTASTRFAAVLTDGVHSFRKLSANTSSKTFSATPFEEVLKEFLQFKTFKGSFLQRRIRRMCSPNGAAGKNNTDDFGSAAIWFGD